MIDLPVADSAGNVLLLSTAIHGHDFDAVTCSPRTDGGFGWSLLYYFIDEPYDLHQLEAACNETIVRNEVCVLPRSISKKRRVLLTPTIRSRDEGSRSEATRLLKDLFEASQAEGVAATRLLVTHFRYSINYPEPHILGILDAIAEIQAGSFRKLKVLGFDLTEHREQFEYQACKRLAAKPGAARDTPQVSRP